MNEQALQRMEPEGGGELIVHQPLPPPSLFGTADPVEVVARASRVAASLKEVIKAQGLISKISGKEYPRCEAWTLLGTMLGVFPVLVWTRAMEGGWEARVEAKTRDGAIVGAAEAQCLKTERNWGNRDDFALRSMAQTRATAKALRMPLGFVMTLGGFQATPAEEMDFDANVPRGTSATKGQKGATQQQLKPAKPAQATEPATEDQRVRWVKQLKTIEAKAEAYGYANGILLPPSGPDSDQTPGEPVECWPLSHTPSTKAQAERMFAEIHAFGGAESPPGEPEGGFDGADDQNASQEPSEASEGASGASDDGVETITGKLEAVSVKEGKTSNGKKWTKYGLKINGEWINSFSNTLGKLAQQDKGSMVRVQFKRGDKGCDLVGIERANPA